MQNTTALFSGTGLGGLGSSLYSAGLQQYQYSQLVMQRPDYYTTVNIRSEEFLEKEDKNLLLLLEN